MCVCVCVCVCVCMCACVCISCPRSTGECPSEVQTLRPLIRRRTQECSFQLILYICMRVNVVVCCLFFLLFNNNKIISFDGWCGLPLFSTLECWPHVYYHINFYSDIDGYYYIILFWHNFHFRDYNYRKKKCQTIL